MARVTKGILKDVEGQLGNYTVQHRYGETFLRPKHIRQPRRLSCIIRPIPVQFPEVLQGTSEA